jgi:hypothetical protein
MTDEETLARLRRRAARTENLGTLRHIADETSDLAGIAPECLLSAIANFQDRVADKIERFGAPPVRRRQAVDVDSEVLAVTDNDPLLQKLYAEHGAPRLDFAPELIAAARRVSSL